MIPTILFHIFHCNCTNVSLCQGSFSQNVVIKCLFPNFMAFVLDFGNSFLIDLKTFLMVVIDISVNHIFHATAPTLKPLIKVFHV